MERIIGRLTYTDLAQTDCFLTPAQMDPFGVSRKPFSRQIARMSAELAADAYDLNMSRWIEAGFDDCTFMLEDRIVQLGKDHESRLAAIDAEWKRRRARSRLQSTHLLGDLMRGVRAFFATEMGKSVVMTRVLPSGHAIVAISFIGTTQKFFDWMTNFKFQTTEGMHQGFLELARFFEAQAERIELPKLAASRGRERMSLLEAMREAKDPSGNIQFWLSGHSQGGALVQTFSRLLMASGIPSDRIIGYTYAAPTVAVANKLPDAFVYPLYNIVNADDMTTRVGAQVRLGIDCVFFPDNAFRETTYRFTAEGRPALERMMFLARQITSTEGALCFGVAMMRLLAEAKPGTEMRLLFSQVIPFLAVARRVGFGPEEMARYLTNKCVDAHQALSGMPPDAASCDLYERMMRDHIAMFGAKGTMDTLLKSLVAPHRIRPDRRDESDLPPYLLIVRKYLDTLSFGIWKADGTVACRTADGKTLLPLARMDWAG